MILQRLYELAERKNLLDDTSFVQKQVSCRIDIDQNGQFLGLIDLRQFVEVPAKGKAGPRKKLVGAKSLPVPVRPVNRGADGQWKTTDPAAAGKEKPAVFLVDTIARVLPINRLIDEDKREKFASQRSTFWRFLTHVVSELQSDDLQGVVTFAEKLEADEELAERFTLAVESAGLGQGDLCTLAVSCDMGRCLIERPEIQKWWRNFFAADFEKQQATGFRGLCQVTGRETTIGDSVKTKIKGLVAVGCRADAYLVTGLESANSFELNGAVASMVSPEGIDGFTRALNTLIGNGFENRTTSHRVGNVMFLFWTRDDSEAGLMTLFEAEPEQVDSLLASARRGSLSHAIDDQSQFYLLTLSGNSARVVVRDYLETPIRRVQANLASWFSDLAIADISRDGNGFPTSSFPLWLLAVSTALDSDGVAPDTPARLMAAAVQRLPVSDSVLSACLRRLRAEGAKGFRAARMGLIKASLIRKGIPMTETLNDDESHYAYLYGRLLAVFEQIQYDALGDVNANVVDKFYGTFSAAPALVFSRLFANAQNHLRKLKSESTGAYINSDRLLSEVVAKLPASPPVGQLSLQDQGRFALGYYHQRAKRFQQIAERKAAKAEK
ncbi:MAG: type I-C CRISPR-associated protein Cas8c/Csd1 [Planctomycetaceae bacterium]|nr:type I-C CRISPR-associated protein Cas8c/Csd1 [Planctomycetaceae bacterium]